MSKALGCKRVHDDRITGVTFEGNASHNALIVNEEYAWVGNPFSAPEEGRNRKVLPSFRMPTDEGTRHLRPQNAPSRGRGCLQSFAEPLARSASASPVFRSRGGQKETPIESKKPCISAICKAFSCILPLLLTQKAASISGLNRDLFCSDRK